MRVAVAGGTGVVGRHVVTALAEQGHQAVVLSRRTGQDLVSGAGLAEALAGADAVIDTSNVVATTEKAGRAFFEPATANLLAAGTNAGVRHHVALSIVGVDRIGFGYYRAKLAQEELVLAGPLPATVLRATQFHEFAGQLLARVRGPVAFVPRMRSRTVAAREVAEHLVGLAVGGPQGLAAELAGPEVHEMPELARKVLAASGSRRPVVGVRLPGRTGRQMASGDLLPRHDGPRGKVTFDAWLAQASRP